MKTPSFARWSFVAVETLLIAFPIAFLITRIGGWYGAVADAAMKSLFVAFLLGFFGMTIWLIAFHLKEPIYAKIGLISFLIISLLGLLAIPVIVQ